MNENQDIIRAVGRLEGKIDGILEHLTRMNGRLDKHGGKINYLENEQLVLKTKSTIYGGLAGGGIIVAWEIFKHKFFK